MGREISKIQIIRNADIIILWNFMNLIHIGYLLGNGTKVIQKVTDKLSKVRKKAQFFELFYM